MSERLTWRRRLLLWWTAVAGEECASHIIFWTALNAMCTALGQVEQSFDHDFAVKAHMSWHSCIRMLVLRKRWDVTFSHYFLEYGCFYFPKGTRYQQLAKSGSVQLHHLSVQRCWLTLTSSMRKPSCTFARAANSRTAPFTPLLLHTRNHQWDARISVWNVANFLRAIISDVTSTAHTMKDQGSYAVWCVL